MPADRLNLRPEDQAAPAGTDDVLTATFPKQARSRFLEIAHECSELQDILTEVFRHVKTDQGKRLLTNAYARTEKAIKLAQTASVAVERG